MLYSAAQGSIPLDQLLTEQSNPASNNIDSLPTLEMLAVINREDRKVADAVERELPRIASAVDAIAQRLSRGGRLFYSGAGTSGRLGVLDASECPPTFNVPAGMVQGIIAGGERALVRASETTEDDPVIGARDLLDCGFTTADVLVGIAASGRTPYVLGAIGAARGLGALTAGISCTPDSELSRSVDLPIEPLTGPEILTGSTRMKAGTATKLVLNMISTGVMIRLGYVFGNLMVNVQPRNDKLLDRARRIVCQATGAGYEDAASLLIEAEGSVKTAILMRLRNISAAEAVALLNRCGGRIAAAFEISG